MATIADLIAKYIQSELEETQGQLELKRKELAKKFNCVPSQITYVLKTRFTPSNGYHVVSVRGGGGFIRIIERSIDDQIYEKIGDEVTEKTARLLLKNLSDREVITNQELKILRPLVSDSILGLSGEGANHMRSRILKSVISSILT
ncbi:MAG: CtsR family transcriptional regulator [Clostridia bacterium]